MGDRRCCCVGCHVFEDDFQRPNSSSIGSWTEVAEDSEIISGELSMPAGAIVVANASAARGAMKVYATMLDLQPDKIYRVILNYDSGVYDYVEYECTDTPAGSDYVSYLRVGSSGAGDADQIEDKYTAGQEMGLEACRTPGGLYGTAENSEIIAWSCDTEPSGLQAGLMNNSDTDTVEFDDFGIMNYEGIQSPLFPSDQNAVHRCYYCACECDGYCLPDTLTLTFFNTSGISTCLENEDLTLTYQPGNDPFLWEGSRSLVTPDCPVFGSNTNFSFYCESDRQFYLETDWGLIVQTGWTGCTHAGWSSCVRVSTPYSLTCSPFQLIYGPFTETVSGNSGTYYIAITE